MSGFLDTLRRYFVANPARIISFKRTGLQTSFVRTRCGNADGFFWKNWHVTWRRPYARCWSFNAERSRWEIKP